MVPHREPTYNIPYPLYYPKLEQNAIPKLPSWVNAGADAGRCPVTHGIAFDSPVLLYHFHSLVEIIPIP